MNMYYETMHTEKTAGFDIVFSIAEEDHAPYWEFESEEERQALLERIADGHLSWFRARVQAFKNGVLLGEDYLGGCCYDSPIQFVNASDYYADMVEEVVRQARNKLADLVLDARIIIE
jgi:hypothetical protein